MNPHELRFRRTGRTLTLLIGLWVGLMVAAAALAKSFPGVKSNLAYVLFALAFFALFVAIFIIGVLRMIAYIRWTGKYPYYFLFNRGTTDDQRGGSSRGR
jgi:CBS domain containing-hemolysin-like protein